MTVGTVLVEPVRIDHAVCARQLRTGKVVVDNNDVDTGVGNRRQRAVRRNPAIDRDDQTRTTGTEGRKRLFIRPVALLHPVGDMDIDGKTESPQNIDEKCRRGGPVDVIVAEHADRRSVPNRIGKARRRPVHVHETRRVRKKIAKLRLEKLLDGQLAEIAAGKDPRHRKRHVGKILRDRRGAAVELIIAKGR